MAQHRRAPRAPLAWWWLGLAAFVLLPWYLPQDLSLWRSLPGVFGGAETAAGLMQAAGHGRPWLWVVPAALLGAAIGLRMSPGRAQGRVLVLAAGFGLAGLLIAGFAIGAKGWAFDSLQQLFGAAPGNQFGVGIGGATTLLALLMLLGVGVARLGAFRGDLFVACAVMFCAACCCCSWRCRWPRRWPAPGSTTRADHRSPPGSSA